MPTIPLGIGGALELPFPRGPLALNGVGYTRSKGFYPVPEYVVTNPGKRGKVLHAAAEPLVGINRVAARVSHLLLPAGPSAIFRAVRSIVVNPFDSRAGWHRPHVCHKTPKPCPAVVCYVPLSANLDAATAISAPRWAFGTVASFPHCRPPLIKRMGFSFAALVCQSVSGLLKGASTTYASALPEAIRLGQALLAAVTCRLNKPALPDVGGDNKLAEARSEFDCFHSAHCILLFSTIKG